MVLICRLSVCFLYVFLFSFFFFIDYFSNSCFHTTCPPLPPTFHLLCQGLKSHIKTRRYYLICCLLAFCARVLFICFNYNIFIYFMNCQCGGEQSTLSCKCYRQATAQVVAFFFGRHVTNIVHFCKGAIQPVEIQPLHNFFTQKVWVITSLEGVIGLISLRTKSVDRESMGMGYEGVNCTLVTAIPATSGPETRRESGGDWGEI